MISNWVIKTVAEKKEEGEEIEGVKENTQIWVCGANWHLRQTAVMRAGKCHKSISRALLTSSGRTTLSTVGTTSVLRSRLTMTQNTQSRHLGKIVFGGGGCSHYIQAATVNRQSTVRHAESTRHTHTLTNDKNNSFLLLFSQLLLFLSHWLCVTQLLK